MFQDGDVDLLHRLLHRVPVLLCQHLRGAHHHHVPGAGGGGAPGRRDRQESGEQRFLIVFFYSCIHFRFC